MVVAVVPGARNVENTEALVAEFRRRTGERIMRLMTSDSDPAFETAILGAYGETVIPTRTGKPGRPERPYKVPTTGLSARSRQSRSPEGLAREPLDQHVVS